ncbi:hypothetical protein [Roseibium sp. Sym1]|uniref:hypothetical protein n=1 Tax=Roseibium sp. Sym1 TaxID=3016006 RepID=UPI0022B2F49B|nr:hypothetical protein [Roseibium sp. Sym1]
MPMFWPFIPVFPVKSMQLTRRTRLQDLEARMSSFLSEKNASGTSCPQVLDNVKAARNKIQREMNSAR